MRLKQSLLPTLATLLLVLLGGCKKNMDTNVSSNMSSAESSTARQAVVNLGVAGKFVILSKSGITDVFPSAITGDIGTSPISGAAIHLTCAEVTGTIYSVDAAGPLP